MDIFYKERALQYDIQVAIDKKQDELNLIRKLSDVASKERKKSLIKDISSLKSRINWVVETPEYKGWVIQEKTVMASDDSIKDVVDGISLVFSLIQQKLEKQMRVSKFNSVYEGNQSIIESVYSLINLETQIGYGIRIKDITGTNIRAKVANIIEKSKLKLQVKRIQQQKTELRKLSLGLIGGGSTYEVCSSELVQNRLMDEARQMEYIKSQFIVYSNNKKVPLSEVVSTEKQRFAELFIQVNSLDENAQNKGFKPLFVTFTAPARFHPKPSKGVSSWDGSTPKESNEYLTKLWNAFRKDINRYDIDLSGFWSVEPHKDQCFHRHALMYVSKEQHDKLIELINKHFKHSENAVRIEEIDTKKSKATSYVMKYLTKSFDMSFQLKNGVLDLDKLDITNHMKVRAATALWRVRRYGLFGVKNTLSLWRELKRKSFLKGKNENIDKAFDFVDSNDFIGFSKFVNGKLKITKSFVEIPIMSRGLLGVFYTQKLIGKYILDIETNEVIDIKTDCKIVREVSE
ncbi:replication endonuclease [Pseudomonas aeruginosa]